MGGLEIGDSNIWMAIIPDNWPNLPSPGSLILTYLMNILWSYEISVESQPLSRKFMFQLAMFYSCIELPEIYVSLHALCKYIHITRTQLLQSRCFPHHSAPVFLLACTKLRRRAAARIPRKHRWESKAQFLGDWWWVSNAKWKVNDNLMMDINIKLIINDNWWYQW